ncbi:HAD-IA family hydrolase [Niveispirillum sp.]|uniref:HAD-IA family hydrolase n=1 Tax=Niveispirillum sp. TaxID=1917217 RepID=UPI001B6BD20F|nr:HAD-IA family hydrolase [Niveispirillum sp.]MBP7338492.1 HAD-IA family hydrolase [Niveispirillum sp.]
MSPLFPDRRIEALLFDMDGTVLSSIKSAERIWAAWAERHGLDVAAFLPTIHGIQSVETIRRLGLPGVDPVAEAAAITDAEIEDVDGIDPIAGAGAFIAALPPARWAIVTSAPRRLAQARLAAAGIPLPRLLIAAEDVTRSKPAPDGFLLAAERLGVGIGNCLVLEDSPAGIAAGEASGAAVLVITATHTHPAATIHTSVTDYTGLSVTVATDGSVTVRA